MRGYRFDAGKISAGRTALRIAVPRGQLDFEWRHLIAKAEARAPERWRTMRASDAVEPHPLFRMVPGKVADWERQWRRSPHPDGSSRPSFVSAST